MIDALVRLRMWVHQRTLWQPLARQARDPAAAQRQTLRAIVAVNTPTRFGREHQFDRITTPEEWRSRVPVRTYDDLQPYVEAQRTTGALELTTAPPLFYAQTSGSTGAPKYIPVTAPMVRLYQSEQALFSCLQYRVCPEAFRGAAWGVMGAATEGRLDSGHTVGSVSGYLYQSLPRLVQRRFVVPPAVSSIADYRLKYLIILRLALQRDDVTYLGTPNPSTFLRLYDLLNEHRDDLARSLESGRLDRLEEVAPEIRDIVARRLTSRPARARQLAQPGPLTFASLWPNIRLLTTWTGGSCGIALASLRTLLPAEAKVMELGYQSTEFRGTLALEAETSGGLPPLGHHYFEFVDETSWASGAPEFSGIEALEPGRRYYVIVTTVAGLYRYFMNDMVEVTGRFAQTPLLRFVQKGKGVTSLTGEKLYEGQVIDAVQASLRDSGRVSRFFLMVADEDATAYWLCLEVDAPGAIAAQEFALDVDRRLGDLNLEYHSKRSSGRLGVPGIAWLKPGAGEAYKEQAVKAGQREGQFKPAVLLYRRELAGNPEAWLWD